MTDLATLAEQAVHEAAHKTQRAESPLVRKLFLVMHGAYGNLFVSKFATGETDAAGKDKGIRAAMMVWDAALAKFDAGVVELAASRLKREHPDFPPNLPQFEKLCDAATPRKTHAELEGVPRLPAPKLEPVKVTIQAVGDGVDWARVIVARARAGDRTVSHGVRAHAIAALRAVGAVCGQPAVSASQCEGAAQ